MVKRLAISHSADYTKTKEGFVLSISKIYGKRNIYTDIQNYINTHSEPILYIPDSRILNQDISRQICHFLLKYKNLEIIIRYDSPTDIPEPLWYFVDLHETDEIKTEITDTKNTLLNNLVNLGFLNNVRKYKYYTN
jgi:hypothetical protein